MMTLGALRFALSFNLHHCQSFCLFELFGNAVFMLSFSHIKISRAFGVFIELDYYDIYELQREKVRLTKQKVPAANNPKVC